MPRAFLLAVFFLSGASALVFEILWTRMAGLVFGSTLYAVSTVLASFMGGLALGGLAFGRLADRAVRPLRLYAGMELLAGILGAAVSFLIPQLTGLSIWLEAALGGGAAAALLRFLAIFTLVLLPTLLMGGTLPVLTRHLTRCGQDVGGTVASLYSANTLGAVLGCLATDFVLVHHLGIRATVSLAAAVYVALALAVLAWTERGGRASRGAGSPGEAPPAHLAAPDTPARSSTPEGRQGEAVQEGPPREQTPAAGPAGEGAGSPAGGSEARSGEPPEVPVALLRGVVFLAGSCALAYEVVWTRLLLFFNGSDIYVFSLMLGTYLFGMGLGSALIGRVIDRLRSPATALAAAQGALAAAALLPLLTVGSFGPLYESFRQAFGQVAGWENLYRLAVSAMVVLPPTVFVGMTFPLANRIAVRRDERTGREVGALYFWSTVGSIAGSLAGGFWLLPQVGVQASLGLLAAGNLAAAALLLARRRPALVAVAAAAALALLFVPPDLLLRQTYEARFGRILHVGEDLYGSLAVVEVDDPGLAEQFRVLVVNGYSMTATNFHARRYMKLLSHLPLLLHRNPERILVVCFGTGQTLGAASLHEGLRDLDCAELSRRVPQLADYFRDPNLGVLDDPRVRLAIQDGRTRIQAARDQYDVITAEPPPPHNAGVVNLYTREFYERCHQALRPGGVVCQWLPVYQMSPEDTRAAIRACLEVFPETSLWAPYHQDLCLVGIKEGGGQQFADLARRMGEGRVREDLASVGVAGPADLLVGFLQGPKGLSEYVASTRPLTDDRPDLQYGMLTGALDVPGLFFRRDPLDEAPLAGIPEDVAARADRGRTLFYGLAYQARPVGPAASLQELADLEELLASTPDPVYYRRVLGLSRPVLEHYLRGLPSRPQDLRPAAEVAFLTGDYATARGVLEGRAADPYLEILLGLSRLRLGEAAGRTDVVRALARLSDPAERSRAAALAEALQSRPGDGGGGREPAAPSSGVERKSP